MYAAYPTWTQDRQKLFLQTLACCLRHSVAGIGNMFSINYNLNLCFAYACTFCFIFCGLRLYAQSHSDDGHVHAINPCPALVL